MPFLSVVCLLYRHNVAQNVPVLTLQLTEKWHVEIVGIPCSDQWALLEAN